MNVFERAALGSYAENVYASVDELIVKVEGALAQA
jgi:hypothetical protein